MIKEYKNRRGDTLYMVKAYLGMNKLTGKPMATTRRGIKTLREARIIEDELLSDDYRPTDKRTFQDVYGLWLETYKLEVRESTYTITIRTFKNHILPKLGHLKMIDIKPQLIQSMINEWFKTTVVYKAHINRLNKIFKLAIQLDIINVNPIDKVTIPRKRKHLTLDEDLEFENYYTKEELNHFLECVSNEHLMWHTFFRLLSFTGLRKGEACGLNLADLDFKNNVIKVRRTASVGHKSRLILNPPKTKSSIRDIPIDDDTVVLLKSWINELKKRLLKHGIKITQEQALFINGKSDRLHPSYVTYKFNLFIEKYNLKHITTHGLRHTHCSLLLEAGVPVEVVQKRLGHATIKMTLEIYTHVSKKRMENISQQFANFMSI